MKKNNKSIDEKIIETFRDKESKEIPSDVQGSYTGNPIGDSVPVQDADDL